MFCPNCGSSHEENQTTCASCGQKVENSNPETYVPYQKTRPVWFYFLVLIALSLSGWGFYSLQNSGKALENIVDVQLTEIRNRQLTKSYYEYASSEFKKNTSFDAFKTFIEKNNALSNFKTMKIISSKQDSNFGVVSIELTLSDNTQVPVKYEFIREDGEWRILRIEIDEHRLSHESVQNEQFMAPIEAQLAAIKKGQLEKAYKENSSDDFKKNTSFEQFSQFIGKFAILSNYSKMDFLKSSLKNSQATVTILLHEGDQNLPIEYTLIHQEGKWQIWSMRIISPSIKNNASEHENPNTLIPPIEKMLSKIKSGDLKGAYEETSSGFKAVTPYEKFENFLKRFSSFKDGTYSIKQQNIDHGVGKVEVELKNKDKITLIEYTLSKENDTWTIWGIQVVKESAAAPADSSGKEPEFDASFLTNEIQAFIQKIKAKEINQAYQNYTAAEFRNATSLEQFTKFVDQNFIFSQNSSVNFENLTFDNNIASIKARITLASGNMVYVKFDLMKEGDRWKILGIKVITDNNE